MRTILALLLLAACSSGGSSGPDNPAPEPPRSTTAQDLNGTWSVQWLLVDGQAAFGGPFPDDGGWVSIENGAVVRYGFKDDPSVMRMHMFSVGGLGAPRGGMSCSVDSLVTYQNDATRESVHYLHACESYTPRSSRSDVIGWRFSLVEPGILHGFMARVEEPDHHPSKPTVLVRTLIEARMHFESPTPR